MSFPLMFDASTVKPIVELSDEQLEHLRRTSATNLSEEEAWAAKRLRQEAEERRRADHLKKRHEHFLGNVGARGDAMDVATAKKYVRARAASCLKQAFEVMEEVLTSNGKLQDRLDVASEIIKRAVGPAAVPNSLGDARELTNLAPVDAIDTVLQSYANGECDETFVKTLLGLLGAKVNGLKIEQVTAKKSADKLADPIKRPPSGKVV
ncbi:hypothetical protein [Mesorhizobium sp. CN2-181]|uniref:hypothetical protein n=1 Tax=Mesorhizobium yinganensis TaxID=3157707 RepID=UPI0032B87A0E